MLGVTLLEIMLVMAIAAMVIVMSIRYYQQAASNQRVAAYADMLTGFIGAAESYIQAGGTFSGLTGASLAPYLPGNAAPTASPWGSTIAIAGGTSNFTATLSAAPPANDCTKLTKLLSGNASVTFNASCSVTTMVP